MNFSGNITQILIILFIALLVFGPKKMVEYAYQAGKMLAKLRTMYEQTMTQVQTEMNQAGLGETTKLVNDLRFDVQAAADKVLQSAAAPVAAAEAALNPGAAQPAAPAAERAAELSTESALARPELAATVPSPLSPPADAPASRSADSAALASAWTPDGYRAAQEAEKARRAAEQAATDAHNPPDPLDRPPAEPGRYDAWLPN